MKKYTDILLFFVVVSLKLLVFGRIIGEKYFTYKSILLPTIGSLLLLISVACLMTPKKRARLLYAFNIIITSFIVSDLIYYGYFRDVISIPVLQNGFLLKSVKTSVLSLINPLYFLFFIDIFIKPKHYFRITEKYSFPKKYRVALFSLILFLGVTLNSYQIYSLAVSQPRLITTMYNRIYVARSLGDVNFHFLDLYNFLNAEVDKKKILPKSKEEEIKTFLAQKQNTNIDTLKGSCKGKNLIIIQVEALQGFVINQKINGNEITPNLNNFLKDSAYFDNFYYQVGAGNTSDAEFMTNNSLYPAAEGAVCYRYSGNDFNSLPKALKEQNYYSAAFHGYVESFWNRNVMNSREGFDHFYGESSFDKDDVVGLGLSDKSFLNQTLSKMDELKSPYYTFITTLSSHYPFDDTSKYGNFDSGKYEGTLLGNYVKSIHYTDEALGSFLKELKERGILDDSLVVIYGDHYAIPEKEKESLYDLTGTVDNGELTYAMMQKVPLIMHFPNGKNKGIYHKYSGEMDIYPTVSSLLGIEQYGLMGKDMFSKSYSSTPVIFRNASFTNGNIFYISPSNTFYDINSGMKVEGTEDLIDMKTEVQDTLEYSDDILNHNLLKKFDEEDGK